MALRLCLLTYWLVMPILWSVHTLQAVMLKKIHLCNLSFPERSEFCLLPSVLYHPYIFVGPASFSGFNVIICHSTVRFNKLITKHMWCLSLNESRLSKIKFYFFGFAAGLKCISSHARPMTPQPPVQIRTRPDHRKFCATIPRVSIDNNNFTSTFSKPCL